MKLLVFRGPVGQDDGRRGADLVNLDSDVVITVTIFIASRCSSSKW